MPVHVYMVDYQSTWNKLQQQGQVGQLIHTVDKSQECLTAAKNI